MKGPGHEGSCKNSGESAAIFLLSTLASMGLNFNSEFEFRPRGTCAKIRLTLEKSDTCRAGRHGGQAFLSCGSDVGLLVSKMQALSLNWKPPSRLFLAISSMKKRLHWYPWRQKLRIMFSSSFI